MTTGFYSQGAVCQSMVYNDCCILLINCFNPSLSVIGWIRETDSAYLTEEAWSALLKWYYTCASLLRVLIISPSIKLQEGIT